MKFLPAEFAYLATERRVRRNLGALSRSLAFLAALVAVYTVVFHWIMVEVEVCGTRGSRGSTGP
jgi:hypothetical protein